MVRIKTISYLVFHCVHTCAQYNVYCELLLASCRISRAFTIYLRSVTHILQYLVSTHVRPQNPLSHDLCRTTSGTSIVVARTFSELKMKTISHQQRKKHIYIHHSIRILKIILLEHLYTCRQHDKFSYIIHSVGI